LEPASRSSLAFAELRTRGDRTVFGDYLQEIEHLVTVSDVSGGVSVSMPPRSPRALAEAASSRAGVAEQILTRIVAAAAEIAHRLLFGRRMNLDRARIAENEATGRHKKALQ
jgi:hypothetical protein